MKTLYVILLAVATCTMIACQQSSSSQTESSSTEQVQTDVGQDAVKDNDSQKDIVKIAMGSADHTTLVAALKQAEYVNDLANAGPFTVFAPTNDAFNKLPKGTVDDLMKDENKDKLREILEYHVAVGKYNQEILTDGETINEANLKNIVVNIKDGKMTVNNTANVVATIPASNGLIYVIDQVLLPPAGN